MLQMLDHLLVGTSERLEIAHDRAEHIEVDIQNGALQLLLVRPTVGKRAEESSLFTAAKQKSNASATLHRSELLGKVK